MGSRKKSSSTKGRPLRGGKGRAIKEKSSRRYIRIALQIDKANHRDSSIDKILHYVPGSVLWGGGAVCVLHGVEDVGGEQRGQVVGVHLVPSHILFLE